MSSEERNYQVVGMSCGHCKAAVSEEVAQVAGVSRVDVDLDSGKLTVVGEGFADADVVTAVEVAGYEVTSS